MSDPHEHDEGQVSEVVRLDPESTDTPLSDGDQVAAYPQSESGAPDEGEETGPDARTGSDHTDLPDERSDDGLPPSD
ncbi:hypothetical protein [Nocardioides pocheonensis]|jgi:hypothetical protein|uniref:Uncharacterized protein n=1 Tax=Nocardioides pocheonensis TaxID=661485 RepID=A0A3N0GKS9_9ACTN|nr:hypothetical protein [Nocardioides pocheonensis]RNM13031.1 hypothetical protein EFL26_16505 [Nocardioides pocheonensis]